MQLVYSDSKAVGLWRQGYEIAVGMLSIQPEASNCTRILKTLNPKPFQKRSTADPGLMTYFFCQRP